MTLKLYGIHERNTTDKTATTAFANKHTNHTRFRSISQACFTLPIFISKSPTVYIKVSFSFLSVKKRVSFKRGFSVNIAVVVGFKQFEQTESMLEVLPSFVHITGYMKLISL